MTTPAAVAAIGPAKGGYFISPEMFDTSPAMTTPAKNPDLVNKIAFLQIIVFALQRYRPNTRFHESIANRCFLAYYCAGANLRQKGAEQPSFLCTG